METGKIKQLLQRYLSGRTSQPETAAVDEWYQSFDNEALPGLSAIEEQQLRQEIWQRISPQITITKSFYQHTWIKLAAMVVLMAGAALAYFIFQTHTGSPAYTEIHTGNRERKMLKMEDGTLLTLNAGSTLRIAKDLSKERRLQLLDGEVFFNVGTDTRRPFIVESGPLQTTVLGTAFNISAYQGLRQLNISVVSGKISVAGNSRTDILQKGQAIIYDKEKQALSIVPAGAAPGWLQGKLQLNDVSFDEMALLIEKNFGVKITTRQERIRKSRYTTELDTGMSPAAAIEVLAAIHQLKTDTANNQVILYE